jgi:hypothetical protein
MRAAQHGGMTSRGAAPPRRTQPTAAKKVTTEVIAPPPPLWRDPWALVAALGVLPVLFASRGVPLGEPVADDFGFLYHALFTRPIDWLGGGGSPLYWRPLSRQLYYLLLAPFAVTHPGLVAALQATLLATAGVLIHRALRTTWPGPAAATAALFPVMLEAARQLVTWSSCAQDLLALVFGTAMLHALSHGRTRLALVWLACALLSKETAIAFAVAFPLWPAQRTRAGEPVTPRERIRGAVAAASLLAVWWLAHEWVSRRAGLLPPPHGGGADAGLGASARALWAAKGVWLDAVSALDPDSPVAAWMPGAVLLLLAPAVAMAAATWAGRVRLRSALPWLGWAAVWSGIATVPLASFMPLWSSHRSVIPAMGVGVAFVSLLLQAGPWALAAVSALRLVAVLASPTAPQRIALSGSNVEFDFRRLGSLQRLAHEVRTNTLRVRPTLPHDARIARNQWPRMSLFAFQDPKAFRVWYHDSTLDVIEMAEVKSHPLERVDLAVEFEPHRTPQAAFISPIALQHVIMAADSLRLGRPAATVELLSGLEREQPDTNAAVFMATALSVRGGALLELRRDEEGAATLQRSLEYYINDANAHRLLAEYHRLHGRPDLAVIELQRHLLLFPRDADAQKMLDYLTRPLP